MSAFAPASEETKGSTSGRTTVDQVLQLLLMMVGMLLVMNPQSSMLLTEKQHLRWRQLSMEVLLNVDTSSKMTFEEGLLKPEPRLLLLQTSFSALLQRLIAACSECKSSYFLIISQWFVLMW